MDIYEGYVIVLLGYNGAGKIILIVMMTGMVFVFEGSVIIYGMDIIDFI